MDRIERLARNQVIFRQVNERFEEFEAGRLADEGGTFICECSREDCTDLLGISRAEYDEVRRRQRLYVTKPRHEFDELERIVEGNERFQVVEKVGRAAAVVEDAAADARDAG